jgi:hypothetical protein
MVRISLELRVLLCVHVWFDFAGIGVESHLFAFRVMFSSWR